MHTCFELFNDRYRVKNTQLSFAMLVPTGTEMLIIETEKVDKKQRGSPLRAMAVFCPFCGDKLLSSATAENSEKDHG
jgi:hypothetical protein